MSSSTPPAGRAARGTTSGSWCSPSTPRRLDWIARILAQHGYRHGIELATIQGTTDPEERELIRARFTAPPDEHPVRVLVATDSAGEGIDLQDYCHRLVNFDIPFNPSRLEQRIGRIDRYGQHKPGDLSAHSRRVDHEVRPRPEVPHRHRHGEDREQSPPISARSTRSSTSSRDPGPLPGRTGRKVRLPRADEGSVIIDRALAGGLELDRALTELSRTYAERKAKMHLTPANALRVVDTALELTGQPPLRPVGRRRNRRGGLRGPGARPGVAARAARPRHHAQARRAAPGHVRRRRRPRGAATWSTSTWGTRCCSAPPGSCAPRCSASTRRCTG